MALYFASTFLPYQMEVNRRLHVTAVFTHVELTSVSRRGTEMQYEVQPIAC